MVFIEYQIYGLSSPPEGISIKVFNMVSRAIRKINTLLSER